MSKQIRKIKFPEDNEEYELISPIQTDAGSVQLGSGCIALWDQNTGPSIAGGINTKAAGGAIAFGTNTEAQYRGSLAIGEQAITSLLGSMAIGKNAKALSKRAYACGEDVTIGSSEAGSTNSDYSAGFGKGITINNTGSFAAGNGLTISTPGTAAFGFQNSITTESASSGGNFCAGSNNKIKTHNAAVFGDQNSCEDGGYYSLIAGQYNTTNEKYSAIFGFHNQIERGEGITAAQALGGRTVVGKYNNYNTMGSALFTVGNGDSDDKRSNAFKVDKNGCIWVNNQVDANSLCLRSGVITTSNDSNTIEIQSNCQIEGSLNVQESIISNGINVIGDIDVIGNITIGNETVATESQIQRSIAISAEVIDINFETVVQYIKNGLAPFLYLVDNENYYAFSSYQTTEEEETIAFGPKTFRKEITV